jgi:tetratricopeptide (TPR) repeat protein
MSLKDEYLKPNKIIWLISFLPFLVSLLVYYLTLAPTTSFWDCGEFIACSYILGIPHPPGNPLFVMLGRIVTLFPIFKEIAARVNLFSALSSALTAWLSFWIIFKLLSKIKINEKEIPDWVKSIGGLVGSFSLAFSFTSWGNAVEAEVYGTSMFLIFLLIYLSLLWLEEKKGKKGDRILCLITFLGFLSTGIHPTVFLVMPALFFFIILADKEFLKDWRFYVTGIVLALVMHSIIPFLVAMGSWFIITLAVNLLNKFSAKRWVLSFLLITSAMAGYSVQVFIPIRSALSPAINENNPSDWRSFKGFLERKQYGDENMMTRALTRRGTWTNQFGIHERMGFWGFFREQFISPGLWIIPLILGGWGIWQLIKKKRAEGIALLFFLLLGTIGLVFYMNFSDGTKIDRMTGEQIDVEVRDRDYFWTPGFITFALFMGLGSAFLIFGVKGLAEKKKLPNLVGNGGALVSSLLLLSIPFFNLTRVYDQVSRKGNYVPYDYAYNLLNSCDKDGILITNGDNDTFPLWFLQEVEKIRKDVRVVNLSLLNTDWYIIQLKNVWKVPMSLTDDQIKWEQPIQLVDGRTILIPKEPYFDQVRNERRILFQYPDPKTKTIIRLQDLLIENIVLANNWKYPIYFANTVPIENRHNLDPYLINEGLTLRVVPDTGMGRIDAEKYWHFLSQVYLYRGLNDINVNKDENTAGLLMNYGERFINLAGYFAKRGEKDRAEEVLKKGLAIYPDYYRTYITLSQFYLEQGKVDLEKKMFQDGEKRYKLLMKRYPEVLLYYHYLAILYQSQNKFGEAEKILWQAFEKNRNSEFTLRALVDLYSYSQQYKKGVEALNIWLKYNPQDQLAQSLLNQFKASSQRK